MLEKLSKWSYLPNIIVTSNVNNTDIYNEQQLSDTSANVEWSKVAVIWSLKPWFPKTIVKHGFANSNQYTNHHGFTTQKNDIHNAL